MKIVDEDFGSFELQVGWDKPGYFVDLEPNGAGIKCIWDKMNHSLLNQFNFKFVQLFAGNFDEDMLESDQALADFIQRPLIIPYGRNRFTSLVECFPTDLNNEKNTSMKIFRAVLASEKTKVFNSKLSNQMKEMGFGIN